MDGGWGLAASHRIRALVSVPSKQRELRERGPRDYAGRLASLSLTCLFSCKEDGPHRRPACAGARDQGLRT